MTGWFLAFGIVWGLVLVVKRRRARRRTNVLIAAGSDRDHRAYGGGF